MNDHKRIAGIGVFAVVLAQLTACGLTAGASPMSASPGKALLRADTDRDGRLSPADDDRRGSWTDGRGAIMLPNLDDDASRCPAAGRVG